MSELSRAKRKLRGALNKSVWFNDKNDLITAMMNALTYEHVAAIDAAIDQDDVIVPNTDEEAKSKLELTAEDVEAIKGDQVLGALVYHPILHQLRSDAYAALRDQKAKEQEEKAKALFAKKLEEEELARRAVWSLEELSVLAKVRFV